MKPTVFNYHDYLEAQDKIRKQAEEIIRLKEENTNLKIHLRIVTEDAKERRKNNDDGMGRKGDKTASGK